MNCLYKIFVPVLFLFTTSLLKAQTLTMGNAFDPCCVPGTVMPIMDWEPLLDGVSVTDLSFLAIASANSSTCDAAVPAGALIDTDGSGQPDAIDPCQLSTGVTYCISVYYNDGAGTNTFYKGDFKLKENPQIVSNNLTVELCEAEVSGSNTYDLYQLLNMTTGNTTAEDNDGDVEEGFTTTTAGASIDIASGALTINYPSNNISETIDINYDTGSSSCDVDEDFTITVFKVSDASWSSPGALCVSTTPITLNADVTVGASDVSDLQPSWSISPTGTLTSNGSSASFTPSPANTYTITYEVGFGALGNGCRVSQDHTFTVNNALSAAWSPTSPICDAVPVDLSSMVTGDAGGTFTLDGASVGSISGDDYIPGQGGNATSPVTVSVTYTVGSGSCGDSQSESFTLLAAPSPSWNNGIDDIFCLSEVTGTASMATMVSAPAGGETQLFSEGAGSFIVSGNEIDLSQFVQCDANNPGVNQTATVEYTLDNGQCDATATHTFTRKCIDTSWANPGPFCVNVANDPNLQALSNPGVTANGSSFSANSNMNGETWDVSAAGAGTHDITYTISDPDCPDITTQPKQVVIVDIASASVGPFTRYGCVPAQVAFDASSSSGPGTLSYEWFLNGNLLGTGQNFNYTFQDSGTYVLDLTVGNTQQGITCYETVALNSFEAIASPQALASADNNTVLINSSLNFTNNSNSFADSVYYTWYWDDGQGEDTLYNKAGQTYRFTEERNYNVLLKAIYAGDPVLESDPSCRDSVIVPIFVTSDVIFHFPNAFTPLDLITNPNDSPCDLDGDYKNDCFGPIGSLTTRNVNQYEFMIFDRWGDKIFEAQARNGKEKFEDRWDGMYENGMLAPSDVYSYIIHVTDQFGDKHKSSGTFMLLR